MLKKTNRLSKTTAVQAALKTGRGFFNPGFNVRVVPKSSTPSLFTVVVSTKVDKRAVKRNRLKRLVREFIRHRINNFKPGNYVIMLKPLAGKAEEKVLIQKLEEAFINWRLL
jgi:ribonuclease P protein component